MHASSGRRMFTANETHNSGVIYTPTDALHNDDVHEVADTVEYIN